MTSILRPFRGPFHFVTISQVNFVGKHAGSEMLLIQIESIDEDD